MNEIYPRWAAADPDPTSTHRKDATRAKAMELAGWDARADEGLEQPRKKRADHRAAATQM